jgi:cobalt-zinc-cadmium efflux system protein
LPSPGCWRISWPSGFCIAAAEKNLNVRAAALHVLGDLLGSVGAIVAALVILYTGWTPVDPILSVLVSCLVLRSAWRLLKESVNELLEGAPHRWISTS